MSLPSWSIARPAHKVELRIAQSLAALCGGSHFGEGK